MSRRQALTRALFWGTLIIGALFGLLSLPAVAQQWEGDSLDARGPTTTSTTLGPTTTVAPVTTQPPPTTPPPTEPPVTEPPPQITIAPPITVAPITQAPATTEPLDSTTSGPSTTTTTRPELLVPARPTATTTTTSTTIPDGDGGDDGMSADTKLALAVGGLLAAAAVIALLTVVYFVKTRPGVEDELGDDEPDDGDDTGELVTGVGATDAESGGDRAAWEPRPGGPGADDPTIATGLPVVGAAAFAAGAPAQDDEPDDGATGPTDGAPAIVPPTAVPAADVPSTDVSATGAADAGVAPQDVAPAAEVSTEGGPAPEPVADEGGQAALTRLLADLDTPPPVPDQAAEPAPTDGEPAPTGGEPADAEPSGAETSEASEAEPAGPERAEVGTSDPATAEPRPTAADTSGARGEGGSPAERPNDGAAPGPVADDPSPGDPQRG